MEIFKLFSRKFQLVFVFQEACAGCQPLLPVLGSAPGTRPLPGPKHQVISEPVFVNFLRSPGIDSQTGGIDSSESNPIGSINGYKYGLCSVLIVYRM